MNNQSRSVASPTGRLQRVVGVGVLGTALGGGLLLALGLLLAHAYGSGVDASNGAEGASSATGIPSAAMLVFAIGLGLFCAATVVGIERHITSRSRRSSDPVRRPLAPKVVMDRTRGAFAGPLTVTVLIPAHNEQGCIRQTLVSLTRQDRPVDRIVVVADNCTDDTVAIARSFGVEVFETEGNAAKKAGALNQALAVLLPGLADNDLVLVMDADTSLDDGFLAGAARRMTSDRALMAVGGLFYGEQGEGWLGQLQRNEYHRYQRDIRRRQGRPFVLTGTATVFRPAALRGVAGQRGRLLPGAPGDVYDTAALTEVNELTLALKSLGALMVSPRDCTVVTEVMPTRRALWAQRLRWQRGALENLGAYGFRSSTFRYWLQQLGLGYGSVALACYLMLIVLMAVSMSSFTVLDFWLGVGMLFVAERLVTVWSGGWRARVLAALILPELLYALFLDAVFVKGIWDIATARQAEWSHLTVNPIPIPIPIPQTEAVS